MNPFSNFSKLISALVFVSLAFGPLTQSASASTCTLPTNNGSYLISSYSDILQINFCQIIDKDFQLINSIDMTGESHSPLPTFFGNFDGGGYSLTGIDMTVTDGSHAGFWSQVSGAEIRDVTFSGSLSSNVSMTGFLAGALVDTTIEDVTFNIDVSGTSSVGGVASQSIRTFTQNVEVNPLDSESEITGSSGTLGGLYSFAMDSTIQLVEIDVDVRGRSNSVSGAGGLLGESYSDNTVLWIDVFSNVSSEGSSVGGLIGKTSNGSAPTFLGSTTVSGDVSGVNYVGGLVGDARYLRVSYSLVTGDVELSGFGGGGLLGMWTGETGDIVQTSGFIGSISSAALNPTADQIVGGLVGWAYLFYGDDVQIKNTHVSADIDIDTGAAGFIGSVTNGDYSVYLSNSYSSSTFPTSSTTARPVIAVGAANLVASQVLWDSTKFQGTVGTPVSGAIGVSTSALSDMSTFTHASWDFEEVWKIDENYVAGLPILELIYDYPIYEPNDPACTLVQNDSDAYMVHDADDLSAIYLCDQQEGEQYFVQMNDIELAGLTFNSIPEFGGHYNGGGFEINTVMLEFGGAQLYGGLFNVLNAAHVQDLTVNGTVTSEYGYSGLLAGKIIDSVITRVDIEVDIEAANTVGGLAGWVERSTVSQVQVRPFSFSSSIDSETGAGGLVGSASFSGFSDIDVQIDINAMEPTGGNVGGLIGSALDDVHVVRAEYSGNISTDANYVGGIVGFVYYEAEYPSSFNQVSSSGNISGRVFVGGVIGQASNSTVSLAFSDMRIEGTSQGFGGIVGQWYTTSNSEQLSRSFYTGEIYDSNHGTSDAEAQSAGGLIGLVVGTEQLAVSDSGAIGSIGVDFGAGGLFGGIREVTVVVTNSYSSVEFDMDVRGQNGGNDPVAGSLLPQSLVLLNSWWDSEKYDHTEAGMSLEILSSGVPTANIRRLSTGPLAYAWNFSSIWMQDKNILSGMPILRGLADFPSTPTNPISCVSKSLPTILFAANSSKLTTSAKSSLNRIVSSVLASNCHVLELTGHASKKEAKKGKKAASWQTTLSKKRAKVISSYLMGAISRSNLLVIAPYSWKGATKLAKKEKTKSDIAKNRRVTIKLS
jgi:outer membrane protein OmpA-like peptidoglycan-associated protein